MNKIIPYPKPVDYTLYRNETNNKAFYGLPEKVEYCRYCVISNQRPNSSIEFAHSPNSKKETIKFDDDGLCDACNFAIKKKEIDWKFREKELIDLLKKHKKNDGRYDCLVPGSGGKDSFFAAHILKYRYGMNPLTITWAPNIYTTWGWQNFQSWIHSGFTNYLFTPNGRAHRFLTRISTDLLLHPFQPFILGQKNLAPRIAAQQKIGLVFYGENEAEYGNPVDHNLSSKRQTSYFTYNDYKNLKIGGMLIEDIINLTDLKISDLENYLPLNEEVAIKEKIEVHYLGYYLKWHPQEIYYYAKENSSFIPSPERTVGTYSKYNSIDDKIDDLHYYTTGIKFGIGRASYDSAQEIRSGDIDRNEGVSLVKKFDHEYPLRFLGEILNYLSIDKTNFPKESQIFESPIIDQNYFDKLCDSFRSPHLWKIENGTWKLRTPLK